jgi:hypothetical protein
VNDRSHSYTLIQQDGGVRTEKKSSIREHPELTQLEWAIVPTIAFTYVTATLPDDELRSLSSVTSSVADLPSMEDYGSVNFIPQFSALAKMEAPQDGTNELISLKPLVDVPTKLMDIGGLPVHKDRNCN